MSRFSRINPFLRGMLILAAIAGLVVVFQLEQTLTALYILARVAFVLAIAYFIFLTWREQREGISMWSPRAQWVFYGAAVVAVADVGLYWYGGAVGYRSSPSSRSSRSAASPCGAPGATSTRTCRGRP